MDVDETIGAAVPFLFPKPSNPNNVSVTFPLLLFVGATAVPLIIGGLIAGTKDGVTTVVAFATFVAGVAELLGGGSGLFIAFATALATAVGVAEGDGFATDVATAGGGGLVVLIGDLLFCLVESFMKALIAKATLF